MTPSYLQPKTIIKLKKNIPKTLPKRAEDLSSSKTISKSFYHPAGKSSLAAQFFSKLTTKRLKQG